jgi:hypothetical protein
MSKILMIRVDEYFNEVSSADQVKSPTCDRILIGNPEMHLPLFLME